MRQIGRATQDRATETETDDGQHKLTGVGFTSWVEQSVSAEKSARASNTSRHAPRPFTMAAAAQDALVKSLQSKITRLEEELVMVRSLLCLRELVYL
jgi:hypothetical protein